MSVKPPICRSSSAACSTACTGAPASPACPPGPTSRSTAAPRAALAERGLAPADPEPQPAPETLLPPPASPPPLFTAPTDHRPTGVTFEQLWTEQLWTRFLIKIRHVDEGTRPLYTSYGKYHLLPFFGSTDIGLILRTKPLRSADAGPAAERRMVLRRAAARRLHRLRLRGGRRHLGGTGLTSTTETLTSVVVRPVWVAMWSAMRFRTRSATCRRGTARSTTIWTSTTTWAPATPMSVAVSLR